MDIKDIKEALHLDAEHLFNGAIQKAWKHFGHSIYKGWGATYTDGIMISAIKTDSKFEQAVRTCCNELAEQILEEMKQNHGCGIEDIKTFYIGDTRISWNYDNLDGDDDIIEADICEHVSDES